jgi:hypothetical protein
MKMVVVIAGIGVAVMVTGIEVGRCLRWLIAIVVPILIAVVVISYAGLSKRVCLLQLPAPRVAQ